MISEPPATLYRLRFALYSAAEMPVCAGNHGSLWWACVYSFFSSHFLRTGTWRLFASVSKVWWSPALFSMGAGQGGKLSLVHSGWYVGFAEVNTIANWFYCTAYVYSTLLLLTPFINVFPRLEQLSSMLVLCPTDVQQIHDLVLTVRHRVGMTIETIGFLRISAKKLVLR